MKVEKYEHGIRLIPENKFEEECLQHIAGKPVKASFTDTWNQQGPLKLEFEPHPWDKQ